jgi:hypothetical protein
MTGFTDRTAQANLDALVASYPYMALFTAAGNDGGTGFTEVTGGSYARVNTSTLWGAAAGSAPSTKVTNAAVNFTPATANWGTVIAWGLYDALTAGNLGSWDYLGNFPWLPVTISLASPGVFTAKAHGYSVADTLVYSTEYGGTTPSFSASNLTGLLAVAHAATDTFDVTNGGTAVNTASSGSGMVRKVGSQIISSGITPIFFASALTLVSA